MTALRKTATVSIEDYLAGEEDSEIKHEYLGGAVHAITGGTADHAAISANVIGSLFAQLRGKPCRTFTSDLKVRIDLPEHTRFYYPDVQVVCDSSAGDARYQERPTVVIEVLSESNRRADLGEKKDAYLAIPSLKVLLLAESDLPYVLVYRRRPAGGFATEIYDAVDAVIPLPEIEASLPLADLYERIVFPSADQPAS